jgi:phospholipase A1
MKLFKFFMIILILPSVLAFTVWVETASSEEFQSNTNSPDITICENLTLNGQNTAEKTSLANDSADSEKKSGATPSVLEQRIILEKQTQKKPFIVSLHRQNYFLGATYNSNPNRKLYESVGKEAPKDFEAKFQLSIRMLVWPNLFSGKADLYAAYTQLSFWQIYSFSSPFRETNYEPELFLSFGTNFNVLGLTNRLFLFGAVHQSNGMGGDLSRSWNRIYVEFIAGRGNFVTGLKAWYRIPEDKEDDDNPDIQHYLGYGHIFGAYKYRKNVFSFLFRNNLRFDENKGSIEVGWSYPIINRLRAYVQYFYGYGESLADYNVRTNRIGIGVMINDWI